MIHVCFGLHDADGRYSKFTGTTIASIFENTSADVTANIFHDATLTDDNRKKFLQLASRYNRRVNFYDVEKLCPNEIKILRESLADKIKMRFSIGMFYRLLVKKIFPAAVEKVIYFDSDIIVNLDIRELWNVDLKNFPLAAVPEIVATNNHMLKNKFLLNAGFIAVEDYFNSGVILFNLKRVPENFFADGVQFLIDNPQCASPDQDILNAFFAKNYFKLEQKFDTFTETDDSPVAKKIYHYAGHQVGLDMSNELQRLWMENFLRSPWCNTQAVGRLYEKFSDYDTEIKTLLIKLSAGLSGRRRVFVSFAEYVDAIKFVFNAADNELIVIDNFADMDALVAALKNSRAEKVFFLMIENYPLLRDILTNEGFVEEKDFFNGMKFLAASHGYRFHSYPFVEVL